MGLDNDVLQAMLKVAAEPQLDSDRLFELIRDARRKVIETRPDLADALPKPPYAASRKRPDGTIEWAT